ncbi:MAG TPA: VCBS repeat-containing protein [Lysobacter sp.]|nr:VCBS repeat-containing protein [Lysobacter sp.]
MNLRKVGSALLLAGMLLCERSNAWNFSPVTGFPKSFSGVPLKVSVVDFTNDGRKDVLMTMDSHANNAEYAGSVMLFRQQADGKLAPPVIVYRGTGWVEAAVDHEAADLNHDGRMDLVVAHPDSITTLIARPGGGYVSTYYFRPVNTDWQNSGINSLVLYDVDGDGQRDIVLFAWHTYAAAFLLDAKGTVRSSRGFQVPTQGYNDFAVGDVDHDGKEDLVSSSGQETREHLVVYGPDGQGGLAVRAAWTNSVPINSIAIGDFDHDGLQEILFTVGGNSPSYVSRLLLDPDWNIVLFESMDAGQIPSGLVAGDINGDGLDDAALYNDGWSGLGMFLQSEGHLLPMIQTGVNTRIKSNTWDPDALAIGDVNSDGCPDLVMGDGEGTYLLQVVRGYACDLSPLPTVDYGMALKAWPMQPAYGLPGAYQRIVTASLSTYSGGEVKIMEPKVYIRLTALPGYKVKVTGLQTDYRPCSIAESTETSALVTCAPNDWIVQASQRIDLNIYLDINTDTQVKVDTWVESGSESRREIRDIGRRNQSATRTFSFVASQPSPGPCKHDPRTKRCM